MGKLKRLLAILLSMVVGLGVLSVPAAVAEEASDEEILANNIQLSRQIATEGMVLLKNDNESLPLENGEKIALFGEGQINFVKGGGGSGDVTAPYIRNLLQGFEIKEEEGKVEIYNALADKYRANSGYNPSEADVTAAAQAADTAIIVIRRTSGEGSDRSATKGDYYLSDAEVSLIDRVCKAGFDSVSVVLNIGGVIDMSWVEDYPRIDSVLLAWQPGMEGGLAVADVMCGEVTPSGKLTDTFARSYADYPSSEGFSDHWDYVDYTEDIYVGYRYFETFDPNYEKVIYEFGYGLSYTYFRTSNIKVTADGENINVSVDVKNVGDYAGKEVVQVYFSAPQGKLGKPGKELAAFAKTDLLQPGKSQTVKMSFPISDMASYDDLGKVAKSAYVMEKGDYEIYVGNSVKNAGERGSQYTYTVEEDIITEQLSAVMTPIQLEERLLADGTYEKLETYETMEELDIFHAIADSGVTRIEAEDFFMKHSHAHYAFSDDLSNCGIDVLTSDAGNRWFTFALDVPAAGNYKLSFGVGNEKGALTDSIKVWVDDVEQTVTDKNGNRLGFPATGGLWNIEEVGSVTVNLPKGRCFMRIEFKNGDNYRGVFDYIKLEPGEGELVGEDKSHAILASGANTIEAEEFSITNGNVGIESISAGTYAGGSCVYGLDQTNVYVEYMLNVAEAGTYDLVFNASNGYGSAHNNGLDVLVNGVNQNIVVDLPNTATSGNQWHNFVDTNTVQVQLPAGAVTLRIAPKNSGFGNLNTFTLTKAAAVATASAEQTPALAAATSGKKITFPDLCEDPTLMDAFLDQLSFEELADLLHGHGTNVPGAEGGIGNLPDYNVPAAETCDGPAGINYSEPATAWPIGTLVACTWNVELIEEMGAAFAKEAEIAGVDILLTPGMNIHRNPLCGRNFEYYSEDPVVTGKIAAALTRGMQAEGVGATLKHFIGNQREYQRGYVDSRVSERALREIYLRGFEIAVKEADAWCIMTSYNRVNGEETAERYDLQTTVLREEWGYEGVVMTDWWNDDVIFEDVIAGGDVQMGPPGHPELLVDAMNAGLIDRETVEASCARVLNMVMKTNAAARALNDPISYTVSADAPTRINAVECTWKHSAVGMEACEDAEGAYNTTDTWQGRWLRYYVDVEEAGVYTIKARVAYPNNGGNIRVSADDVELNTIINDSGSTGYQDWKTTSAVKIMLPAGRSDLRLDFLGGVNLYWFELEKVETASEIKLEVPKMAIVPGVSAQIDMVGSDNVNWSVKGATSANTKIDAEGNLTIGEDEVADFVLVYAVDKSNADVASVVKVNIFYAPPAPDYELGDVDMSGTVDVADIMKLKALIMADKWSDEELAIGDMDGSDSLDVGDIMAIKNIIMSK